MKQFITALAAVMLFFSFLPATLASDDIKGHEFESELRSLMAKGIIGGYGDGTIKPDNPVTRAEFAKLVVKSLHLRAAGLKASSSGNLSFADVTTSDWFFGDVRIAVDAGLINGYPDGTFKPNREISREEMAAMINRALKQQNTISKSKTVNLTFKDLAQINPVFIEDVQGVVSAGVMNGYGNGNFGPATSTTRGQVAAVLSRVAAITEPADDEDPDSENPANTPVGPDEGSTENPTNPDEDTTENPGTKPIDPEKDTTENPGTTPKDPDEDTNQPKDPVPPPKPVGYMVATLNSNGEPTILKEYETYTAAKESLRDSQIILKGDKVVYMKLGTGIAAANSLVQIYRTEALTGENLTYVSGGTELKYLGATEKTVKVEIAGTAGYVDAAKIQLIPNSMSKGRSYYKVINGDLFHSLYNPIAKNWAAIMVGSAPSFMKEGEEYRSWDGVRFETPSGTLVAYSYFMFMPLHTASNYTADDLDLYLEKNYRETEELPDSPLVGTGEIFKEMERKYGVNALYLMAHAIHESNWGKSLIAQDKKNLYGIQAFDSDAYGSAKTYASFAESIEDAAIKVTKEYQSPTGKHYNGAVLGNKGIGMNIRYASDPFWGEKIAGHMYRADQYLGEKDGHQYKLAVNNVEDLRVRSGAGTDHQELYTMKKPGTPFIYQDTTQKDGATWYEIRTDDANNRIGYVYGDGSLGQYVIEMPVAR